MLSALDLSCRHKRAGAGEITNHHRIIGQMQETESITEKMKEDNQWEWIRRMGSIYNRAEEIMLNELIYR